MKLFRFSLIISLSLLFVTIQAQILIPEFEKPQKLNALNMEEAEESMPVPFLDGENMYFVRTFVEGNMKQRSEGQEIYQSVRTEEGWASPQKVFNDLNDNGNNAVIGSSKDGNTIYVFNSIQSYKRIAKGLAYAKKGEDGVWGELQRINIPGFEIENGFYSFYINPEENVLLISMPQADTTFYEDLYFSLKQNGEWTEVKSLGNIINTNLVETSPYLADDGKTLYFASSGHEGFGQTDIFVSYRQDDSWTNWTKPLNLGAPINSQHFESYFTMGNNQEVYFVSNREQRYSDIYYTKFTKKVRRSDEVLAEIQGEFNYNNLPAEGVNLEVYDENGNLIEVVETDEDGKFRYKKLNSDETYLVKLAAEDANDYAGGEIYFVDEKGNKVARFKSKADGQFEDLRVLDEVSGQFTYEGLPADGVKLKVYDANGNLVDEVVTDEFGNFRYQKLNPDETYVVKLAAEDENDYAGGDIYFVDEKGNKIARFKSKADGGFEDLRALDEVSGQFTYKNLPAEGVKLNVYDANGNLVDEVVTDEFGNFRYQKLNPDETYVVKLAAEDENDYAGGEFYFVDAEGNKVGRFSDTDGGVSDLMAIDQVAGQFNYEGLPTEGVKLVILNADGDVIEEIITDENGRFNYTKLNPEETYLVQLDATDNADLSNGKIYFLDKNGGKIGRFTNLANGNYSESSNRSELSVLEEEITGVYKYEKLPVANAALVVFDENGFPIDTIYTDVNGSFTYSKLKQDKSYTLLPIDLKDNNNLEDVDLYLVDANGNRTKVAYNQGSRGFSFESINEQPKTTVSEFDGNVLRIYFDFNVYELSAEDKNKLDQAVLRMKKDKSLNVLIEGHTDNVGTADNNLKVSRFRAKAAKKYLENNNISANRISIVGKGESEPLADNDTDEGRSKNRRVELVFKD
ncbi:MAG: hypothetical protein CMC96_00170 [Flavobacteriales bacterium]|nr:hypothetical protein [Flavobacteriales bacterium]|tara:strand:+ start:34956 stop:37688 length:2733 start_codon:yes stop_codon:yes gene_type:complete